MAGANPRKTNKAVNQASTANATRKLVVEGGWVQKGLYDIGWSDEKKCRGCNREGTEEAQAVPMCVVEGGQEPNPRRIGERAEGQNVEGRVDVAERTSHPLS